MYSKHSELVDFDKQSGRRLFLDSYWPVTTNAAIFGKHVNSFLSYCMGKVKLNEGSMLIRRYGQKIYKSFFFLLDSELIMIAWKI